MPTNCFQKIKRLFFKLFKCKKYKRNQTMVSDELVASEFITAPSHLTYQYKDKRDD